MNDKAQEAMLHAELSMYMPNLLAPHHIPVRHQVLVQLIELVHVLAGKFEVENLRILDDAFLGDRFGDDNKALSYQPVRPCPLGRSSLTCCKPHRRNTWATDLPLAPATLRMTGWSIL